jgi:beta-glucosidase
MRKRRRVIVAAAVTLAAAGIAPLVSSEIGAAQAGPNTACPWVGSTDSPADKATAVLAQMTLDEKFKLITATQARPTTGIPRLCIPGVDQTGGPGGPNSNATGVTQLPTPLALAASFDPSLAYQYGTVMGSEARVKGVSLMGGPTVNIARTPLNGRTYESYGEDPYLSGSLAAQTIQGIQSQGEMAMVKHYATYNQETNRTAPLNVAIDEQTLHEIYLPAFEQAVEDGVPSAVMCSYSSINGTPACADSELLTDILKTDWGFQGLVTPDWGELGRTGAAAAANGGVDYEVPSPNVFNAQLKAAVAAGTVPMSRLDDMAYRVLYSMFRTGLFDNPVPTTPGAIATTAAHQQVGLDASEQGTVLLKNDGNVLPLDAAKAKNVVLLGSAASTDAITTGGSSAGVVASGPITTPLQGITARAGNGSTVNYIEGVEPITPGNALIPGLPNLPQSTLTAPDGTAGVQATFYGTDPTTPLLQRDDTSVNFDWGHGSTPLYTFDARKPPNGTQSERWTGTFTAPGNGNYTFDITASGQAAVTFDGAQAASVSPTSGTATQQWTVFLKAGSQHTVTVDAKVRTSGIIKLGWQPPNNVVDPAVAAAAAAAKSADVAVVFADNWALEGADQTSLNLPGNQNELIDAVTKANPNTIVVLNTGGPVTMPWVNNAKAVLEAWYPGQSDGSAIAALLYGDVSPSAHLPMTFPVSQADIPTAGSVSQYPGVNNTATYSEGVDVGYRWYDAKDIKPLFPFGYGLTYSKFAFNNLQVSPSSPTEGNYTVTVNVRNNGSVSASDVVQAYVADPSTTPEPPRQLRAFRKVTLAPGESTTVTLSLNPRDFAYWSTASSDWQVDPGQYTVYVGDSSAMNDLPQVATVNLSQTVHIPASSPIN